MAAGKGKDFPHFDKVMSCILPCEVEEAAAFFTLTQWITRRTFCETHEDVIEIFRLFGMYCWSERDMTAVDRVYPHLRSTRQDRHRAERILKRIRAAQQYSPHMMELFHRIMVMITLQKRTAQIRSNRQGENAELQFLATLF